jgi:hypothetical protein
MNDRLDRLLERMPARLPPPDLILRIEERLNRERRRRTWYSRAERGLAAMCGVAGVKLATAHWNAVVQLAPELSPAGLTRWMEMLLLNPGEAAINLTSGLLTWRDGLLAALPLDLLVGSGLLGIAAAVGLGSALTGRMKMRGATR